MYSRVGKTILETRFIKVGKVHAHFSISVTLLNKKHRVGYPFWIFGLKDSEGDVVFFFFFVARLKDRFLICDKIF